MTGPVAAAAMLAAAVLTAPATSGRRLAVAGGPAAAMSPRAVAGAAACAALGGVVLLPMSTVVAAGLVGATLALRYRRRRLGDRVVRESHELHTAIEVLVGELRVGAHPARAFAVAAQESSGPVSESCRAVAARARLGADVTAGLHNVAERSALPSQWDRLAQCWRLAAEHGLAMSTLMRAAQLDIAERQRFCEHVRSALAGARATAAILAGLPLLSVLLGELIGAHPVAFLLGGGAGGWLLVAGTILVCGGLLWSDRITDRVAT